MELNELFTLYLSAFSPREFRKPRTAEYKHILIDYDFNLIGLGLHGGREVFFLKLSFACQFALVPRLPDLHGATMVHRLAAVMA